MTDHSDFIASLGFSIEDALQAIEDGKRENRKDKRICVCGHAARAHTSEAINSVTHQALKNTGRFECSPGRQKCPCKEFKPVLTVSDPRKFLYRTTGVGPAHALGKGIAASAAAKLPHLQWTEEAKCDVCGRSDIHLVPVALRRDMFESDEPTGWNVLLCEEDRIKVHEKAVAATRQK